MPPIFHLGYLQPWPNFTGHNWVCSIPSTDDAILRMLVDIYWAMWGKV